MLDKLSAAGLSGLRWMMSGNGMEEHEDGFEHELDMEPQRGTVRAWADRMQTDFSQNGAHSEVFHGLEGGTSTRALLEEIVALCADADGPAEDAASLGYTFGLALGLAAHRTAATTVTDPADVVREMAVRIRRNEAIQAPNQFVLAVYKSAERADSVRDWV